MWKRRSRNSSTAPIAAPVELDDEALSRVYGGGAMPGETDVSWLYARAQALASNPNISEMDRAALQSALMALSSFALTSSGNPGDIETIISQLESKYTNLF